MEEEEGKITSDSPQSPITIAQFAALLSISAILNEIAESDGKINVDRLILKLKTQPEVVEKEYPESLQLVQTLISDMESRRVK